MTHCVKTGALIWIEELSATYPADIYAVGPQTLVVRFNVKGGDQAFSASEAMDKGATHFMTQSLHPSGDWVRGDIGVAICQRDHLAGELYP